MTALAKIVPLENFNSSDEVGLFLFGWQSIAPKLCTTRAANDWSRAHHVSLSNNIDPNQQRVAHIGATLQAHTGNLACFYLRIVDSKFPLEYQADGITPKPKVFVLNKESNFCIVFCHPDVADTIAEDYIGRLIVLPTMFRAQENTIQKG